MAKTILLIDDDEDDRSLFHDALKEIDGSIRCITSVNGQDGLLLLNDTSENLPDFIFLDLNMPCMNGKQCLAEIKKDSRLSNIPVIIYSTTNRPEDEVEMKKLGAACFVTKPALFREICSAIVNILDGKWVK
jgi:CheY-like chemotaxis protein